MLSKSNMLAEPKQLESVDPENVDPERVERLVEQLCGEGCKAVWGFIDQLEQGEELAQAQGLSEAERASLLLELKSIMSVYAGTCSI